MALGAGKLGYGELRWAGQSPKEGLGGSNADGFIGPPHLWPLGGSRQSWHWGKIWLSLSFANTGV